MPEGNPNDDVEKILADEKAIEDREQALIADLLKQREAANKAFDEKLEKLGYEANSSRKAKRSHHKRAASQAESQEKPKAEA